MNEQELILAAIQLIAQAALQGDQNAQAIILLIMSVAQNIAQNANGGGQAVDQTGVSYARAGAKLNYLKTLRGNCPEGTELQYYKAGGRICKKCVKKHRDGNSVNNPIDQFRSERRSGKMKKNAVGGTVDQPAKYNKGFCKKH